jgi:hypothetical protein
LKKGARAPLTLEAYAMALEDAGLATTSLREPVLVTDSVIFLAEGATVGLK